MKPFASFQDLARHYAKSRQLQVGDAFRIRPARGMTRVGRIIGLTPSQITVDFGGRVRTIARKAPAKPASKPVPRRERPRVFIYPVVVDDCVSDQYEAGQPYTEYHGDHARNAGRVIDCHGDTFTVQHWNRVRTHERQRTPIVHYLVRTGNVSKTFPTKREAKEFAATL